MSWSFDDLQQSLRYGTVAVFIKHYGNGKSQCKRMRIKKQTYYLDEVFTTRLPPVFNGGAIILTPGDMIFICQNGECSIIREKEEPIFEIIGSKINKKTKIFRGEKE